MKKYRPPLPEATNDALTLLLEKCWHDDPDERPSFSEIHAMLVHVKEQGQWTNPHPRSVSCQLNVVSSQIVVERGDAVDFVSLSNLSCDGVLVVQRSNSNRSRLSSGGSRVETSDVGSNNSSMIFTPSERTSNDNGNSNLESAANSMVFVQ